MTHELFLYVYVTPLNICHIAKKIVVKGSISLLLSEGLFVFLFYEQYKNKIALQRKKEHLQSYINFHLVFSLSLEIF